MATTTATRDMAALPRRNTSLRDSKDIIIEARRRSDERAALGDPLSSPLEAVGNTKIVDPRVDVHVKLHRTNVSADLGS